MCEDIFYLNFDRNFDRPILAYVRGEKFSLAIDAGASEKHIQDFYDGIEELGMKKPDFTVITHWHWDHTFGMKAVAGITIAHSKTNEKLQEMKKWKWTDEAMKQRLRDGLDIEFADTYIRKEYPDLSKIEIVTSDMEFEKNMKIDLGGMTAEIYHSEAVHSEDSVLVLIPERKILFMGDAIGVDYYNNCALYPDKYQKLIENIDKLDFDICVLGHCDTISKKELLKEMKDILKRGREE